MKYVIVKPSDLIGYKPCDIHTDPKHCEDVNNLTDSVVPDELYDVARVTIKKNEFDELQGKTYIGNDHIDAYDNFTNDWDDAIGTAKHNLEQVLLDELKYRMTCNKAGFYLEGG